jgi:hypothetical protein
LNKRRQQFIRVRNETFSVVAMCVCIQIVRPLESFPGCAPFRRHWRNPHAFIWRFRAGFPALHQWKGIFKMKTFIVYDLDSQIPAAVGEQVSAETARY